MYAQKPLFVRVYDMKGNKIDKGRVIAVTDSTLELNGKSKTDTILVQRIGSIRTRHSAGNTIGISSAVGLVIGTVIGVAGSSQPNQQDQYQIMTPGEEVASGIALGLLSGAIVGAIGTAFKDSKHFIIHGNAAKWKAFQLAVADYNAEREKNNNMPAPQ
jgi:hypothetical protein